jgi:NADPH:quinone reductase-like Zn-dependent oxidoreductase/acyl carrier protein
LIHPALLDGALQALLGLVAHHQEQVDSTSFLPWRFGRVRLVAPFGRAPERARVRLTRVGVRSISADVALFDSAGGLVTELLDCWFRRMELTRSGSTDDRTLRVDLVPLPLSELDDSLSSTWAGAILSRLAALGESDQARREQALLLEALIGSVAFRAMRGIVEPGRAFTLKELCEAGLITPSSSALAESLLRVLERFGAATEVEAQWRLQPSSDLPEPQEVWRLLLADAPDLVAELALIAAALEALPRVLREGPNEPSVPIPPMVEHLLQGSPASAASVDFLCDALHEIASEWPKGRPLRILELGAVGGAATRRVLERLASFNVGLIYVATSREPDQAARLSFLARSFTGVSARHWSPEDGVESLAGPVFDIILSINAAARLQLDTASFTTLRDLLGPGGIFIAVEPEPNALWDLVFGQSRGWWRAASCAGDASPLRSPDEWRAELAAAGFRFSDAASRSAMPWPCGVFWGIAPPRGDAPRLDRVKPGSILLVAANSAFAGTVGDRLSEAGYSVALADASKPFPADEVPGIVAFLVEDRFAGDPVESASRQTALLAGVAAKAAESAAVLWIITCDAQQAAPGSGSGCLVAGALWSLGRALVNEMPKLSVRLLDVPGNDLPLERASKIALELAGMTDDDEVVWTPHGRHVLRLRRGLPPLWATQSDVLTLEGRHPGGLDSLGWETALSRSVGHGQVEIEVHATGLNFRDIMWAMGLFPEEALIDGFAGPTFGLECAGVVRSIGSGVTDFAVGDRVMGFAPASLSTRVVTVADAVAPIPPETSFAAAATIPVTFVTAIYALGHLAKLSSGEYVLIHAAAGGVGLAAIQYAKHCGAVVIATAGSEVKRSFLRLAGADHVLDSRDLAFSNAVREITDGQGVDVVLNSLSGEAMDRSLEVLKPFGRFLELGKRDLYLNRRIRLRPLRQNISYFAIDIDQLPIRRPNLARALLAEVSSALSEGAIRPLAHRVFTFAGLDDAFRLMQSSGHIGKIVLVPAGNSGVQLRQPPPIQVRRDGTYLITGGVEGFGFEAARWLVARGAGSIALVSRRGSETPGCDGRVRELEAAGAEVRVYRCNIADREALAEVLDAIRRDQPTLRGVVHAASAVDDGLADEIQIARARSVLLPKLGGAFALDALTCNDPIELFLLFSSATTLVGAPGQGVYVAANMALEALARRRQAEGKPGLAVAWGPIEDVGYLARKPEMRAALARRLGAKPITAAEALSALPAIIASGLPVVALAETNWNEARRILPILATPLFSEIRGTDSASPSDESLSDRLASLDLEAATALLKTIVVEEAATILRLPAGNIDPLRPLSEMGMDSLMAVELRLGLESRLRVDLPLMSLAEGTSVASIAARLAGAVSTRSSDSGMVALVARHESVDESPFLVRPGKTASSVIETKSVAAE